MKKISTLNKIVQYLYGEMGPRASIKCMEHIMRDRRLTEEFEMIADIKESIEAEMMESPSPDTIKNIMREARAMH